MKFLEVTAMYPEEAIIRSKKIIKLSAIESQRFVDALLNPPKPNESLKLAAKQYQSFIENKSIIDMTRQPHHAK